MTPSYHVLKAGVTGPVGFSIQNIRNKAYEAIFATFTILRSLRKPHLAEMDETIMFTPARDFLLETPWRIIIPNPNVNSHSL
jgi:hypothetical protein